MSGGSRPRKSEVANCNLTVKGGKSNAVDCGSGDDEGIVGGDAGIAAVEVGARNARSGNDGGVLIFGGHRHRTRTGDAGGEGCNGSIELNFESAIVWSANDDEGVLGGGIAWIGGDERDRIAKVQSQIGEAVGDVFKAVQPIKRENYSIS